MIEDTNLPADDPMSSDLRLIARGPDAIVIRYENFISNGFRFHTKEVEYPIDCDWHVMITTDARAKHKMQPMTEVDIYLQSNIRNYEDYNEHEEVVWIRDDVVGVEIDTDL
ncbi:hypothetical protein ZIOFF_008148 [Zingiber officinale]|uniref:Uncharacterized protein n=1 Tax=Zingiber officinale TaxID=94328 RepID=A0A8J5HRX5_ZINOF|nr:hypothetical protein ZIOFF_008148 [Zingiber officinale]